MQSVKVSTKHQIVVPSEARRQLAISAGDRLTVEVRGEELVLKRRLPRASDRLRGLGAHVWEGVDPTAYVRDLRREIDGSRPRAKKSRARR